MREEVVVSKNGIVVPYYQAAKIFKENNTIVTAASYAKHLIMSAFTKLSPTSMKGICKIVKTADTSWKHFVRISGPVMLDGELVELDALMFRQMFAQSPFTEGNPDAVPYFKKIFDYIGWNWEENINPEILLAFDDELEVIDFDMKQLQE